MTVEHPPAHFNFTKTQAPDGETVILLDVQTLYGVQRFVFDTDEFAGLAAIVNQVQSGVIVPPSAEVIDFMRRQREGGT